MKKFVRFLWNRLDDFDKYILRMGLIFIIILIFIGIISPNILDNPLEWISKTFSVPITQEKIFSFNLDALDILFFFIIFIIILGWAINKLVKLKFKRKK